MARIKRIVFGTITASVVLIFSGCGAMMNNMETGGGSEDKIKTLTALELDMSEQDIALSNKRVLDGYTYYTITAKKGTMYNCRIMGGGWMLAGQFEVPQCAKKGEKLPEPLNFVSIYNIHNVLR